MNLDLPPLTTEQMKEVDRLMVEEYHIQLIQMMENAGRHLAALGRERFLGDDPEGRDVLVLAGSGGNGGGGMAAARRLHAWGAEVRVFLTRQPQSYEGVLVDQLKALQKLSDVPVKPASEVEQFEKADLILDALIGYSLQGPPYGQAARMIGLANVHQAPILSLDVPSGLDAGSGRSYRPHIQADATLTLAMPKQGLLTESARTSVGDLYLADIGVPPELYRHLGVSVGPIFSHSEILKIF